MMPMILGSIAFSSALLLLLCIGDPKRRRSARQPAKARSTAVRNLSIIASLIPGGIHAMTGDAGGFLIWLGGYALAGWLITLAFASAQSRTESATS
ncbi:MAG: hypothetical protein ABW048_11020 [Sphingobium sp.]